MYSGQVVFAQLMEHSPLHTFRRCVQRYPSKYPTKTFSHLDQFLCMAFAQLTYRESLRDIETCLRAQQAKLYYLGIRGNMAKSTLADANEQRDCRIYMDFAMCLIHTARQLYASDSFAVELEQTVYALDTTTIDLCLNVFPWARFRSTKAAVKMQTLLDLRGNIPPFIHISDGKMHEVNVPDIVDTRSRQLLNHGSRLHRLRSLVRAASSTGVLCHPWQIPFALSSHLLSHSGHIHGVMLRSDHCVDRCEGQQGLSAAPATLTFYEAEHDRHLVFLTKIFDLPALTIARLYRCRWQVELFFSTFGSNGSMAPARMPSRRKSGSPSPRTSWSPS